MRSSMMLMVLWGLLLAPLGGVAQAAQAQPDTTGTIRGRVFGGQISGVTGLGSAVIDASSGHRHLTVTADASGAYVIRGVTPGTWKLRALHVGYEPLTAQVHVPRGGIVTLDLELNWHPVALPPLIVRGEPVEARTTPDDAPSPAQMGEVALRALEGSTGMVEGGLTQVVRSLPGHDPAEPQDVLLMRGSATDLKLVLLDGAPVYTPFHMAGLVDSFDPDALGSASLFLGGAPARFDGGLSYILDLHSRSPGSDRIHGAAAVDLLTGKAMLEGPLTPSTGFLVSARTIHDLGSPVLAQGSAPYGYGDLLARWEWRDHQGGGAYVTGFWNRESVLLDLLADAGTNLSNRSDFGPGSLPEGALPGDGARWGNKVISGGVRGPLGETFGELRVAASRYEAELPVEDSVPLFASSRSDRVRITVDFSRPWGGGALRFGGSVDRQLATYSALTLDTAQAPVYARSDLDGVTAGLYAEGSRSLLENVQLKGGLRADRFRGDRGLRVAPRVAVTWMLTDAAALTIAAGRYHQYSNLASGDIQETLKNDAGLSEGDLPPLKLTVAAADHLVVSLDQLLLPRLRLGLEGFVKQFTGLSGSRDSRLSASGVDLRVAGEGERASGWLGYTLTWFWAEDGLLASGNSPFSGRHLLSAGMTTSLTERTGLRLRASYGDGLPYTSVPVSAESAPVSEFSGPAMNRLSDAVLNAAPELVSGPDEGFFRLEVEAFARWFPELGGHTIEVRPYLRVLNALNRRDALFYHFDPWRSDSPEPLADLPVLPLFGLECRF